MKILLIDADICVYSAAFGCVSETEEWKVKWTVRKSFETLCTLSGCTHYIGYLTDSPANFRIARATTWPYKGNRKSQEKPEWFDFIRKEYEGIPGFSVVSGIEADDALTISAEYFRSQGIEVACATKDKDLKQYPWDTFVDMNTDVVYTISPETAHRNLWHQMLIGDVAVDNIPGLSQAAKYSTPKEHDPKVRAPREFLLGKAGADKLLDLWDPSEYAERTYEAYVDAYWGYLANTDVVQEACDSQNITFGEYRFYETWDLIHMLLKKPKDVEVLMDYHIIPKPKLTSVVSEFDDVTDQEF